MLDSKTELLNPAYAPGESPVDFRAMTPATFARWMKKIGYVECTGEPESLWEVEGRFVRDARTVFATLRLMSDDGEEVGHADLSALSCIRLAEGLIEHGIACSNVNNEPEVVADAL